MSGPANPATNAARRQCADAVLMVRPKSFGFNPDTATTNAFQRRTAPGGADAAEAAVREFDRLVKALRTEGIDVCVVADTAEPKKPDAVFPNNWVSFHEDGTLVLYPLAHASRRSERREEVFEQAVSELNFHLTHLLDLTWYEAQGKYLEGTGSLVLDHMNRVAYACASPRTDPGLVTEWGRELGYEPLSFAAADRAGVPLYHTNVCLWIGAQVAMVAAEAIAKGDRERVLRKLTDSGREVITIGERELGHFAGNMLELATWDEALGDSRVLVMSESAKESLDPRTYQQLSGATDTVLSVPVPTIEALGGGSVRCMLAEVFR